MSDERKAHLVAIDAWRRRVGVFVLHPVGPGGTLALTELPAQYLAQASRRRSVAVEEALPVKMIGDRAVVGFHAGYPDSRDADRSSGAGEISEKAAASDRHGGYAS